MESGRILGIDTGERRVGLALSDETRLLARPLLVLSRGERLSPVLDEIQKVVTEYGVVELLVGLPLHTDGSEGRQARRARSFAATASSRLGVPAVLWDERYSSLEAESIVRERPATVRRPRQGQLLDAVSAAVFLQHYLDALRSQSHRLPTTVTGNVFL